MRIKIAVVGLIVLALGAGVGVAATSSASSGLDVCVNNSNGAMRLTSDCRDGEHLVTLRSGGGNATATQNGVFSVAVGETGGAKTLPLTGLILSGRCEAVPPEFGGGTVARPLIESASGTTMDAFSNSASVVGGATVTLAPVGALTPSITQMVSTSAIVTSNGATATITFGGYIDQASGNCRFLWQAVEVANS